MPVCGVLFAAAGGTFVFHRRVLEEVYLTHVKRAVSWPPPRHGEGWFVKQSLRIIAPLCTMEIFAQEWEAARMETLPEGQKRAVQAVCSLPRMQRIAFDLHHRMALPLGQWAAILDQTERVAGAHLRDAEAALCAAGHDLLTCKGDYAAGIAALSAPFCSLLQPILHKKIDDVARPMARRNRLRAVGVVALALAVVIPAWWFSGGTPIPLAQSSSQITATATRMSDYSDAIFLGTVLDVQHISVAFSPPEEGGAFDVLEDNLDYWGIVTVQVDEVLATPGGEAAAPPETVEILVTSAVGGVPTRTPDAATAAQLTEGAQALFFATQYDDSNTIKRSGQTLYLSDLAPYGLFDRTQFLIVQGNQGLHYYQPSWPTVVGSTMLAEAWEALAPLL